MSQSIHLSKHKKNAILGEKTNIYETWISFWSQNPQKNIAQEEGAEEPCMTAVLMS